MINGKKTWPIIVAVLCIMLSACGKGDVSTEPLAPDTGQNTPSLEEESYRYSDLTAQPKQLGRIESNPRIFSLNDNQSNQEAVNRQQDTRSSKTTPTTKPEQQRATPQPRTDIKGIYVSQSIAGSPRHLQRLVKLVENTDLNAMVIDVKDDFGRMTYDSSLQAVDEIGADQQAPVKDVRGLVDSLKKKQIYLIGRIVTFKDPLLAKKRTDWAIHRKDGSVWHDRKGVPWVDPYRTEVQSYNKAIAKEAAELGFDEIQFDYVRFPDNGAAMDKVVRYANARQQSKSDAINAFLNESSKELHAAGSVVSADVFGLVTSSKDDMGIGQTWRAVSSEVDVISPMTYPSHYSTGVYGVAHPDLEPGKIIRSAMRDARRRNEILAKEGVKAAHIRPWLQSFSATWVQPHQKYGPGEIREQILAARAEGINQFLLWSASCRYPYKHESTR